MLVLGTRVCSKQTKYIHTHTRTYTQTHSLALLHTTGRSHLFFLTLLKRTSNFRRSVASVVRSRRAAVFAFVYCRAATL